MKKGSTTTEHHQMKVETLAILNMVDLFFPGGRDEFLKEIVPLIADEKFYTTGELADKLRVSVPTIKNWRKEGKITPTLKIPGGSVRYTLADFERFKEIGRKEATQA